MLRAQRALCKQLGKQREQLRAPSGLVHGKLDSAGDDAEELRGHVKLAHTLHALVQGRLGTRESLSGKTECTSSTSNDARYSSRRAVTAALNFSMRAGGTAEGAAALETEPLRKPDEAAAPPVEAWRGSPGSIENKFSLKELRTQRGRQTRTRDGSRGQHIDRAIHPHVGGRQLRKLDSAA